MVATHFDVVAVADAGILALGHRGVLAIVQPHHDAPCDVVAAAALADLVADDAAGHSTSRSWRSVDFITAKTLSMGRSHARRP